MYMILTYRTTCLRIYITTTSSIIIFFSNMISTMGGEKNEDRYWTIMEEEEDEEDKFNIATSSSNSLEGSTVSNGSSSSRSSDMADDATSSSSSSSSLRPTGSLYDLSELMAKLPIKRGLSKFYQGKSQSFTSLSRVTSIEDLPKKETHFRRKMKASKSYGNGFDSYKSHTLPKPTISKKSSRSTTSLSALSFPSRRGCFVSSCRPPMIPQQKNLDFRPV